MYITHLTINTGHTRRSPRSEVRDEVLTVLAPWLMANRNTGTPAPLPVPALSHYGALVLEQDGGLVVTVYAPAGPHLQGKVARPGDALVSMAVAQRSRHGAPLWAMVERSWRSNTPARIQCPPAPWIAVLVLPSPSLTHEIAPVLADMERCIAWAWVTRRPQLGLAT